MSAMMMQPVIILKVYINVDVIADISEMVFFALMLMSVWTVVIINAPTMLIVSILMGHMTVNVKMVFMVMVTSTVFMTNCVK